MIRFYGVAKKRCDVMVNTYMSANMPRDIDAKERRGRAVSQWTSDIKMRQASWLLLVYHIYISYFLAQVINHPASHMNPRSSEPLSPIIRYVIQMVMPVVNYVCTSCEHDFHPRDGIVWSSVLSSPSSFTKENLATPSPRPS